MPTEHTISTYLIHQLHAHGVGHVFGVPGDYVLGFFNELDRSPLHVINTCDEQGAGFAADAYARVRGLGCVCITYGVGGLKVINTTAQAFAEKSPVIVISGAPGNQERINNPLLHHKVRNFDTQLKVFEQVTVATAVLDDAGTAFAEIDRVLTSVLRFKRPGYIELPRNMIAATGSLRHAPGEIWEPSDPSTLAEALREATDMINAARKPAIIAGVELHRFGLQDALLQLIEQSNIPVTTTLLSKSVISEDHLRFMGVYEGALGHKDVREYIESSDCLISLGTFMTDVNLGLFTACIDQGRLIYATSEKTFIRHHTYEGVHLWDFLQGLLRSRLQPRQSAAIPRPIEASVFHSQRGRRLTVQRLFQCLNAFVDENTAVIADTGDALFAAADMTMRRAAEFIAPAYYTSLGFAVPASIGVQLANPALRPLVVVGDGAFQMTGMELATVIRFELNPIVVVLNNRGYGTVRSMQDGSFNDLQPWRYSRIPEILGEGRGFDIESEEQLEEALSAAREHTQSFSILEVHLDPHDSSPALQRLAGLSAARVRTKDTVRQR